MGFPWCLQLLAFLAVSATTLLTYALAVAAIVVITGAFVAIRVVGRQRPPRQRVIAPRRSTSSETARRVAESREARLSDGRRSNGALLREKGGAGREFVLGVEPAVIGASGMVSTIVLDGDGIAPEHARIWLRQERYLLHHVGGLSRKTYVSGQEADWVVLEPGDEVTIGSHRLVFEDARQPRAMPAAVVEVESPRERSVDDDLARMEAAVRELWAEALPASETAVGERSGTGKYKVHRRKDELAQRLGGTWVKRGRTVVLER
jgi:hypothetical protein